MTLIDSSSLHNFAFTAGTLVFLAIIIWAIWFAFNMD